MDSELSSDICIAYASGNNVFGYLPGKKMLRLLYSDVSSPHINFTGLGFVDGRLLVSGHQGVIIDVFTGGILGTVHDEPLYRFADLDGRLVAVTEERKGGESRSVVYDVRDNSEIASFAPAFDTDEQHPLSYRPRSLDMVTADGKIYLASQNVVSIRPGENGRPAEVRKLSDRLCDVTLLASNGHDVFSISYRDEAVGIEIREQPSNRRVGFFYPHLNDGLVYRKMFAMAGNTLIAGASDSVKGYGHLYSIPVTREMRQSEGGLDVTPRMVLHGAFENNNRLYGAGNPIAVMPADALDRFL